MDRRTITFRNNATAVGTVSWLVDRDSLIQWVVSSGPSGTISNEPDLTQDLYVNPLVKQSDERFVIPVSSNANWKIPIKGGSTIYATFSAQKGTLVMCLSDPDELQLI